MTDDFDLPDGWIVKPLGEAAQLVRDKVEPALVPSAHYIGLEHVEAHTMRLLGSGRGSDVKSAKTKFAAGDVLYGKLRPYLNKVTRAPFDGISSTDFLVFTESADLDMGYLAQFLNQLSVANHAHHLSAGVQLPRVDWKSLSALPISFPIAKPEQRTIARAIERARRAASSANDHLELASRAIDQFRQSVLAAACSGLLTTDFREAERPVEALLAAHAESSDTPINKRRTKPAFGLAVPDQSERFPSTWAYLRVRELVGLRVIIDVQDGNHGELYPRKTDFGDSGVPFLSAESVWNVVDIENAPRLKPEVAAHLRIGFAKPRDIILTHNATVGRVAIIPDDAPPVVLSTSTTYYRVDQRVLLPHYLLLYMRSPFFQEQLSAVMSQTTRNQVPVTKQVELVVAVPSSEEQRSIVQRTERILALAELLTTRIQAAAKRVDRSSQAVLAKAFRGEFVYSGASA